jgi:hypothetical protein
MVNEPSSIDKLAALLDALGFPARVSIRRVNDTRFDIDLPDHLEKLFGVISGTTSEEAANATIDALINYAKREQRKHASASDVILAIYGDRIRD